MPRLVSILVLLDVDERRRAEGSPVNWSTYVSILVLLDVDERHEPLPYRCTAVR